MTVKISAFSGIERVAIEVSKQEARGIHYQDMTWELMEVDKWVRRHEPCGHGPCDSSKYYVSVDGGERRELTDHKTDYMDWPENESIWVEVISHNEGEYNISFDIDEEFDPTRLTMVFDHVYDKDYGILSHVTYRMADDTVIEAECEDIEDRGETVVTMIHNAGL